MKKRIAAQAEKVDMRSQIREQGKTFILKKHESLKKNET